MLNVRQINPLNAELNPICYLLALLGAHHILHISRIRVNLYNEHIHILERARIFIGFVAIFWIFILNLILRFR